MRRDFYDEFLRLKRLGLKAQAKAAAAAFIASFENEAEKRAWTREFLTAFDAGTLMPHEIYEAVVFPVLLADYRAGDSFGACWLAGTMPNVFNARHLWKRIGEDYPMPRMLVEPLWKRGDRSPLVRSTMRHLLVSEMHRYCHDLDVILAAGRLAGAWDLAPIHADVALLRELDEQGVHEGLALAVADKLKAVSVLPD